MRDLARLVFEGGYSERDALETPARGYRSHVWAELSDGTRCPLTFYDPTRLAQTLTDEARAGRPYLGEPGLVVLTQVTRENMEAAARQLARDGFFDQAEHPWGPGSDRDLPRR